MADSEAGDGLTRLDPRQKSVMRVRTLIGGLVPALLLVAGDVAASLELGWRFGGLSLLAAALLALAVAVLPGRRWRRWGYRLGDEAIRIARGWLFRFDTLVPLARVQHIDIARGPLERLFGVATLILHTAGSYNSTVALPGLAPEEAERLREAIRAHNLADLP